MVMISPKNSLKNTSSPIMPIWQETKKVLDALQEDILSVSVYYDRKVTTRAISNISKLKSLLLSCQDTMKAMLKMSKERLDSFRFIPNRSIEELMDTKSNKSLISMEELEEETLNEHENEIQW